MSASRLLSIAFLATAFFLGCVKDSNPVSPDLPTSTTAPGTPSPNFHQQARNSGEHYSQSIPVDEANKLISSYLTSVNYPNKDTALRSFTFDADTLRAYLRDTSIVTLKFFVAHTPAYANNDATYGKYAGMRPDAITFVIAGMNGQDGYVRSSRNGYYEHTSPCPFDCPGIGSSLLD